MVPLFYKNDIMGQTLLGVNFIVKCPSFIRMADVSPVCCCVMFFKNITQQNTEIALGHIVKKKTLIFLL